MLFPLRLTGSQFRKLYQSLTFVGDKFVGPHWGNAIIESEILQKMKAASIDECIAIIELLLQPLKAELPKITAPLPQTTKAAQRPAFSCMQCTESILSDIVSLVLPGTSWEALQ